MAIVSKEVGSSSRGPNKTCHQCRQKRDNVVFCVGKDKNNKACPLKFCLKCLLNIYGEVAAEAVSKDDWVCPRCRGICNCSECRKNQGLEPSGNLVKAARDAGFRSANEYLEQEGAPKCSYKRKVEPGQENSVEGNQVKVKKSKKLKCKEVKDVTNGYDSDVDTVPKTDVAMDPKIPRTRCVREKKEEHQEVKLPEGTSTISVSGIVLPAEDAENALHFMEFCFVFGKALDLREGQADGVIQELFSGRRQEISTLTQTLIQLVNVILHDRRKTLVSMSATEDSWLTAVGECLSKSGIKLDHITPEMFQQGLSAYETMDSSQRLKLLNFLCDEDLGTTVLRNCIVEATKKKNEVNENLKAAKKKEKQLKQKLQDELAKAEADNNGIPLTILQSDEVKSQFTAETAEFCAEKLATKEMLEKTSRECDVVLRTKPVEVDDNGFVFWKLNCYNEEPNILVQDLSDPQGKWSAFTPEQKLEIEKYINFIRMKRSQAKKNSNAIPESVGPESE